jgi:hypothetical protein
VGISAGDFDTDKSYGGFSRDTTHIVDVELDVGTWSRSVDELDRTFVSEIVAAVDPAPEWFEPGRE